MPIGLDDAVVNDMLDALVNGNAFAGFSPVYIQLHTGGPGPSGTNHVAATVLRKAIAFGTPVGGVAANSGTVTWTGGQVSTETITNWSLWDSLSGGTFLGAGNADTPVSLVAGTAFTLNPGDVTVSMNEAG